MNSKTSSSSRRRPNTASLAEPLQGGASEAVHQLCPACGLCCNGGLFGDVELQPGDDPKKLTALGLDLFRKRRKQCFRQPCACFDGKWCRIYPDRPQRCRTFECRLLQRAASGEVAVAAALRTIREMRDQLEKVRELLRDLGNQEEHLPLNRRYAAVVSQPIDLAGDEASIERRSELMLAVARLTGLLEREFLG